MLSSTVNQRNDCGTNDSNMTRTFLDFKINSKTLRDFGTITYLKFLSVKLKVLLYKKILKMCTRLKFKLAYCIIKNNSFAYPRILFAQRNSSIFVFFQHPLGSAKRIASIFLTSVVNAFISSFTLLIAANFLSNSAFNSSCSAVSNLLPTRSNNSFDICSTSCNALSTIFLDSDDDVFAWPIFRYYNIGIYIVNAFLILFELGFCVFQAFCTYVVCAFLAVSLAAMAPNSAPSNAS
ncbi:hypothetical protein AGLY_006332 [Aphis glycines]|uniref:Uncharacterized protein n=1 Tax=Aphis glycines TaxID=307491 RepID=A0A6G0TRM8_APHGL|nr:hypothetical protein AGLY_006332 [Aphis glycines]